MKKLFLLFIAMIGLIGAASAQSNLITNGSFENDFWPSRQPGTAIFGTPIAYSEPARIAQYFDEQTQPHWPKIDDATTPVFDAETGVWYIRNTSAYNYTRVYVDELKNAPDGDKCLTILNTKYYGTSNRNQGALSPYQYVACQRLSLDNGKKYKLSFSYMKMDSLPAAAGDGYESGNYATRFVAGVVSSTEPSTPKDYTFVVDIPIPATGDISWKDTIVFLDLPSLIAENDVLDFTLSAIIFGIQTQEDPESEIAYTMMPGQISIDNVVLEEDYSTSVSNVSKPVNYSIINRSLVVNDAVQTVRVYNMLGGLLYENMRISAGQQIYTFTSPGAYIVKLNDQTAKVVVQ